MKLVREPLVHFIVLGAVLFAVYVMGRDVISPDDTRRIAISAAEIALLADSFERQWGRSPSDAEMTALIDERIREEVMYREALAMGLDRNDIVVRRRMMQKMELLSQDLALLADPTEAELDSFLRDNSDEYRIPPRVSFSHVYFNADKRGSSVEEDARRVLGELRSGSPIPERAPDRGDRFMLAHDFVRVSPFDVRRNFGSLFADSLFTLAPGWHGPLISGFGLHLVNVLERLDGRMPALHEVREALRRDYNRVRFDRFRKSLYQRLSERYEIEIDREALQRLMARGKSPDGLPSGEQSN